MKNQIHHHKVLLLSGIVASSFVSSALASSFDGLRSHRAVYDLVLSKASDRSGITGMDGRIVYEFKGSVCEGYAVRFRFFTNVQTARKAFTNDQRTTSFESADGKSYNFVMQSYLNGQLEQDLRGDAERQDNVTAVSLKKPEQRSVSLGPSIFMTEHVASLVAAAKKQQTIMTAKVFDGSDTGDQLVDTTAVIGKKKSDLGLLDGEPAEVGAIFKKEQGWPVSVSYFSTKPADAAGERLPIYQVSFLMHESGVSRDLKMSYKDYSLKGDLKSFEYLDVPSCD